MFRVYGTCTYTIIVIFNEPQTSEHGDTLLLSSAQGQVPRIFVRPVTELQVEARGKVDIFCLNLIASIFEQN